MDKEVNLKAKNTPMLWILLSANILIICGIFYPLYFQQATNKLNIVFILKGLGASIAPLLLFLLNGLLSSNQKAILIFWRLKDPLPGSEAFSKLSKLDTRINRKKLKEEYGPFPKKSSDQNRLWYEIYKQHALDIAVSESHRAFLLARDLTSMCFLFVVFIGVPTLLIVKWPISLYYFLFLLIQYFAIVIGARNRGRRFVMNVLAVASNSRRI
ncbi:hypothetical protein [Flavobacterium lindanitolerans]|uniref:Glycosyl-4,4'-diaponeurosporenoate acyltransferase n=1 Tax=Flavobacterium lindanitolerans TaxID=428988 RepID=A0A497UVU2_9FLAO|nr:hypothetical protein [Flavobacterium lindanitolerans]PKW21092.1 hypothetical protein B0G92_2375 [Flavobacterium lindanitolerans]RLJ30269.1 hypothetical protein CLV50_1675 [Flavobacterium lindanitolerans]